MRFAAQDTAVPDGRDLILQLKDFAEGPALSTSLVAGRADSFETCRAMRWDRKLTVSTLVRNSPALAVLVPSSGRAQAQRPNPIGWLGLSLLHPTKRWDQNVPLATVGGGE